MKNTSKRYSPEVQKRAVRLVFDYQAKVSVAAGGGAVDRAEDRLHA